MEISNIKLKFLNSLGIDINNLPKEFDKINKSYKELVTREERDFLYSAPKFVLPFSMRDVCGTEHINYENMTFFESFLKTKRGDENLEQYFLNKAYYFETLKQLNQSSEVAGHDTPIELCRTSDGNCIVLGGNNRINIMMMLYLSELSKAKTIEEKNVIDKKYTFYAEIKSLPKNRDVFNSLLILEEKYNVKFLGNDPDDCHYLIFIDGEHIEVRTVEELKKLLFKIYSIENITDPTILHDKIYNLVTSYITYEANFQGEKTKLLKEIYPDLEEIKENFLKLRRIYPSNLVFSDADLSYVNNENLLEFLINVTEKVKEKNDEDTFRKIIEKFANCRSIEDLINIINKVNQVNENIKNKVLTYTQNFPDFVNYFSEVQQIISDDFFQDKNSYTEIYNGLLKIAIDKKTNELNDANEKKEVLNAKLNDLNIQRLLIVHRGEFEQIKDTENLLRSDLNRECNNLKLEEQKTEEIEIKMKSIENEHNNLNKRNFIVKLFKRKTILNLRDELKSVHSEISNALQNIAQINEIISKTKLQLQKNEANLSSLNNDTFKISDLNELLISCDESQLSLLDIEKLLQETNLEIIALDIENKESELEDIMIKNNIYYTDSNKLQ